MQMRLPVGSGRLYLVILRSVIGKQTSKSVMNQSVDDVYKKEKH